MNIQRVTGLQVQYMAQAVARRKERIVSRANFRKREISSSQNNLQNRRNFCNKEEQRHLPNIIFLKSGFRRKNWGKRVFMERIYRLWKNIQSAIDLTQRECVAMKSLWLIKTRDVRLVLYFGFPMMYKTPIYVSL